MAIQQIDRQNVSKMAFEQMRDMIANGDWPSGSKIQSENKLAAQLGVSRVTVRSAIHKLSGLGLVESRPGEGTYVCQLDGTQAFNSMIPVILLSNTARKSLHELRTIVECGCARLAAARITDEQLKMLRKNVDEMQAHESMPEKAAADDLAFHKGISDATGNLYLKQVFSIIETNFTKSLVENAHHMGTSSGIHFHRKLCDALEKRDAALAESVMEEHLKVTYETMLSLLEENK